MFKNLQMQNKELQDETKADSEQKPIATTSSPNAAKPNVIGSASEKPTMEKYGWHEQCGFDDDVTGWYFEGGEEAYYEALKEWESSQ